MISSKASRHTANAFLQADLIFSQSQLKAGRTCPVRWKASYSSHQRKGLVNTSVLKMNGNNEEETEDTATETSAPAVRSTVKRKVAIFIGFLGGNFLGMQFNPIEGARSVEGELVQAVLRAGYLMEANSLQTHKMKLSRSARTDKGVSACLNCVAMKLEFKRDVELDLTAAVKDISEELPKDLVIHGMVRTRKVFNARFYSRSRAYEYLIPVDALSEDGSFEANDLSRLSDIFQEYPGRRRDYSNFTQAKKLSRTASTERKVISINCKLVTVRESKFVAVEILGESFIYHQIRKMISSAIMVYLGLVPKNFIELALDSLTCNIYPVPGELLFLCSVNLAEAKDWGSPADSEDVTRAGFQAAKEISRSFAETIYEEIEFINREQRLFHVWWVQLTSWYLHERDNLGLGPEEISKWQTFLEEYKDLIPRAKAALEQAEAEEEHASSDDDDDE